MKYLVFSLLVLGGTLIFLSSCDKDDESHCTEVIWYEDADGDGLGQPDRGDSADALAHAQAFRCRGAAERADRAGRDRPRPGRVERTPKIGG